MTVRRARETVWVGFVAAAGGLVWACANRPADVRTDPVVGFEKWPQRAFEKETEDHVKQLYDEGREIFRHDTFGSEAFWGEKLKLHRALVRAEKGGVGEGLTARQALQVGLKVDVKKVPRLVGEVFREGAIDLDDPDTTLELLRADAVVGVKAFFDDNRNIASMGITCALCHSTVDDSFMKGIGRRLDGWPNRDLDVGKIATMAPEFGAMAAMLGQPEEDVREVLLAWGPGKYDAEFNQDGKGFRPDGKSGATLIPAAFGLAGQNSHTYGGWGSVPYWNAYVANTQMFGKGTFVDRRLSDSEQYPLTAKTGFFDKRDHEDLITGKLPALHFYQLAIPAPTPPKSLYDERAAARGELLFNGEAKCAQCHVPPLFSEPGYAMHTGEEIGIDSFQSERSPDRLYRTTPLRGLFARSKGGFYHDGRFPDLDSVVMHYQRVLGFTLSDQQRRDLVEYLKSL
jgi:hypothetical protein